MKTQEQDPGPYKTNYRYTNPAGAGPYRGSLVTHCQYAKGELIRAPFGQAIVTSCRRAKAAREPKA